MDILTPRDCDDRHELGRFLKSRRARLKPSEIGLKAGPRRRAPGLLREEVASAAGMSATWYTWMEQGRPTNPSAPLLDRLAKVLQLDAVERAHLFRLARPETWPAAPPALDPSLVTLLRGLHPHPAYVFDALWNVVAWNEAATALLGAFDPSDPQRANVLVRLFRDPSWRLLFADWEMIARSAVAQYRAATAGLAERHAILRTLEQTSPDFIALWNEQEVAAAPAWRKVIDHPEAGRLVFDYAALGAGEQFHITIYTPADAVTAGAFADQLRLSAISGAAG